jgi:hypothetical protein
MYINLLRIYAIIILDKSILDKFIVLVVIVGLCEI